MHTTFGRLYPHLYTFWLPFRKKRSSVERCYSFFSFDFEGIEPVRVCGKRKVACGKFSPQSGESGTEGKAFGRRAISMRGEQMGAMII